MPRTASDYARRYASTASTRRCSSCAGKRPSFPKIELTRVSTVFGLMTSFSQTPRFEVLRHQLQRLALARRQLVEQPFLALATEKRHHLA